MPRHRVFTPQISTPAKLAKVLPRGTLASRCYGYSLSRIGVNRLTSDRFLLRDNTARFHRLGPTAHSRDYANSSQSTTHPWRTIPRVLSPDADLDFLSALFFFQPITCRRRKDDQGQRRPGPKATRSQEGAQYAVRTR